MQNIIEHITEAFIEALENGENPFWVKPWNGRVVMPRNFVTGKTYRGINLFYLALIDRNRPTLYCTFNQAKANNWKIRKGSKARKVVFWNWFYLLDGKALKDSEYQKLTGEQKRKCVKRASVRYYNVFNIEDVEGADISDYVEPIELNDNERYEQCEELISASGAKIATGKESACYCPTLDSIDMPAIERFKDSDHYYHTLFHELGHWTGHESRCDRNLKGGYGNEAYAKEELIAEMTANYLCGLHGIDLSGDTELFQNSASYLAGWASKIKENDRLLMNAAQHAQRALDYIYEATGSASLAA